MERPEGEGPSRAARQCQPLVFISGFDFDLSAGCTTDTVISLRVCSPEGQTVLAYRNAWCVPSFLKFFSLVAHGALGTQRPGLLFFTLSDNVHRHQPFK